ncbi:MAG: hypothetical protein O2960_11135 [Verrucomicrobia bacterium]|nr:hypothetical protein [Verrucomicrobiota bacterium]
MNQNLVFDDFIARVRAFIGSSLSEPDSASLSAAPSDSEDFEDLALHLFRFQFENVPVYRRFCEGRGVSEKNVHTWREIPALPVRAFKEFDVSSLPVADRTSVFYSSGTAGQKSSRHLHSAVSLGLYESALLRWFSHCFLNFKDTALRVSDLGSNCDPFVGELAPSEKRRFVILTPAAEQAPNSSLVHMFETIKRVFGDCDSVFAGDADSQCGWTVNSSRVVAALENAILHSTPVIVLGTAFSYVHLLDFVASQHRRLELPVGSKVLETGGYKGRSRTLTKCELHSLIETCLGVSEAKIISEYGMSELSSQAYLRGGFFRFPPWAAACVVSPETGDEVGDGEQGLIRVFDLANARSVMGIQTEDLGVRRGDAFELIGRAELSEPRGCSLMAV